MALAIGAGIWYTLVRCDRFIRAVHVRRTRVELYRPVPSKLQLILTSTVFTRDTPMDFSCRVKGQLDFRSLRSDTLRRKLIITGYVSRGIIEIYISSGFRGNVS